MEQSLPLHGQYFSALGFYLECSKCCLQTMSPYLSLGATSTTAIVILPEEFEVRVRNRVPAPEP